MFSPFRLMRQIRVSDESHRVTTFELFFDLVFVFAFTQVTAFMAHEHTGLGVLQGMIILGILWWSWVTYSWLANQTHVDEGIVRLGMSVAMITIFISALAIPEAFHDLDGGLNGPLVLAVAYFIVRLVHLGLYLIAAGDDVPLRRQVIKTSSAMFTGSGIIITGALIGGSAQTWFWLAGLAVDITLTYLTSTGGNWRVHSAAHWTERYGLVVILALGESIVAIGVGASQLPVGTLIIVGSVFGVGLSICLWWLYFDTMAIAAEHVLARLRGRARSALAVDAYSYLHLPLIAGVVLSALGVEDALAHVDEPSGYGWLGAGALLGGTALYLLAHAAFCRRIRRSWKPWRLGTAALLVALIPAASGFAPLTALGMVFGLCLLLVLIERTVYAQQRAEIRGSHSAA
ncbi:low temperature requirement protein A [Arthrobacter sp. TMN-37]